MNKAQYKMHLILNTHWDREYRWSFRETQMRLVEAVDQLINIMESDSRFTYFHTDSQVSFLDDYLEVRPENRDRVVKLVSEGRILTGPWYTLPSEFMVSGEALVRNLLMGHRIAKDLGHVMKAGYNIFSWGQVSQLPQIYRQFGMDTIMFYRGIDQSGLDKLEFWWEAPDGTRAMGITFGSYHRLNFWVYVYLPYIKGKQGLSRSSLGTDGFAVNLCDSYSKDMNHHIMNQPCCADIDNAIKGMQDLMETVVHKSSTRQLLFLQGFDQENPDPVVPDLIDKINGTIDYGKIVTSSLPQYIRAVRDEMRENGAEKNLKIFKGEMLSVERSGDPFAPLYIGTFSARIPLKQLNTKAEYRLERWAEPAAVWAMMRGTEYPAQSLQMAWKELLQNQQHDGIGGCHMDRVMPTMVERYATVEDISETVTRNSLNAIVAEIDFSRLDQKEIGLAVFNSLAYSRSETISINIDIPVEWGFSYVPGTKYRKGMTVEIIDCNGNKVPSQILGSQPETVYSYLKYGSAFTFESIRITVAFQADIPAMGYSCFTVCPRASVDRPVENIAAEQNVLENEFLKAVIRLDGSIDLLNKASGKLYCGLHYFEDGGEKGGPLIYSPPNNDAIYTTAGQNTDIALIKSGPLYASYCISRSWLLPESLATELKVHVPHGHEWIDHSEPGRSACKAPLKMSTTVVLRKESKVLEFETVVENNVKDHRLRVLFPTQLTDVMYCDVDSPFDIPRRAISIPDSSGWYESAARTLPSHSFIDISDGKNGLAIIHNGLPEYEVVDNKGRAIALTLLRCFGTAGNPTETWIPQPLAQCQGSYTFNYSVYLHSGNWNDADVIGQSEKFNIPMRAAQCTSHKGPMPLRKSFFEIKGAGFVITALKKAEDGNSIILRGYNPTANNIAVCIKSAQKLLKAQKVTLEEIVISQLEIDVHNSAVLPVAKGEIVSAMLTF